MTASDERQRVEQAYIDGSVEGSQVDRDGNRSEPRAEGRPGREDEAYDAGRLAGYEEGLDAATPLAEGLTIEALAGALYDTDPPESWMRTGTDEYRKRAAAMLDILAATPPPKGAVLVTEETLTAALEAALAEFLAAVEADVQTSELSFQEHAAAILRHLREGT